MAIAGSGAQKVSGVILPETGKGPLGMFVAIISSLLSSIDTLASEDLSDFLLVQYNKIVQFRRTAYDAEMKDVFITKMSLEILAELMVAKNKVVFERLDPEALARLINYASAVIPSDLRLVTHKDLDNRAHSTQAIASEDIFPNLWPVGLDVCMLSLLLVMYLSSMRNVPEALNLASLTLIFAYAAVLVSEARTYMGRTSKQISCFSLKYR